MSNRSGYPTRTVLTLLLLCGAATPILAQTAPVPVPTANATAATHDFRSFKWLSDRSVVNNAGDEIAELSDFIIDRGTGRIEYAIVKTGTTLGMGGRAVAIPFASLRLELGGKDRYVLASSVEQLKAFPEYSKEHWLAIKDAGEDKGEDKNGLRTRLDADAASPSDPYAGVLNSALKASFAGEVIKTERVRTSQFGEQVIITVKGKEDTARRISLGPSWFVNATSAAPIRGDKVEVETLALPRDPDQLLVATNLSSGNRTLRLRDSSGAPAWSLKSRDVDGKPVTMAYSRYTILGSLSGVSCDCRGEECGKVNDIIIESGSGQIAFLSIDPNENLLGIRDTKRLLPWSIVTVMIDRSIRIDASKQMVLASAETPSTLSTLNTGTHADAVYKAFDVPHPVFADQKTESVAAADAQRDWAADGTVLKSIENGTRESINGEVLDLSEMSFDKGVRAAKVVRVKMTSNGGERLVLIGPSWYMDNQKPTCKAGDAIKMDVSRATINGKKYWIAHSLECKEGRVVLLDAKNVPVWGKN